MVVGQLLGEPGVTVGNEVGWLVGKRLVGSGVAVAVAVAVGLEVGLSEVGVLVGDRDGSWVTGELLGDPSVTVGT